MIKFSQYRWIGIVCIIPQILVTLIFFIWPAISALLDAFFFGDAFGLQQRFAGFQNFQDLFSSHDYAHAIAVTIFLAGSITFLTMSGGLILAGLVHARGRSQVIYKTLFLWPYAVAPAVAALLWKFLCHPTLGWVTQVLKSFNIDFNYMIYPNQALTVIVLSASWQQFSYNFLFFFIALKSLPPTLLEVAILDGAGWWRSFWQIQFPLLAPTTFFLLVMNMIYSFFDTFGIIDIMTGGGPDRSTTNLIYKVYEDGFIGMDLGLSSAQSVLLLLMVVGLTFLQFHYLEKKVHYI